MERRDFSSYLTWSDEDEKRLVFCTDVGMARVPPGSPYPPSSVGHPSVYRSVATGRVVNEYQLVYVTAGRGSFTSGGHAWPVSPGSVLAVFPGVGHSYRPDSATGWEERWVGFKGPSADELRDSGFLAPAAPFFQVGVHESILSVFSEIFSVVETQEPYYQFRAGALVLLLIAEVLGRARKAEQHGESEALVEKAKFLMAENLDGTMNVDEVGERLGVSQTRFYESFKAYTGMTPYQYFIQLKIHRAKEILSSGRTSVKEVAFRLGFDDQYYFSRLFKKKTGVAPSEWAGG